MVGSRGIKLLSKLGTAKTILFAVILCLPLSTTGKDYLPTIFWDPTSPAVDAQHWSKVVNVEIFQFLTFVCPTNLINIVRSSSFDTKSYYNLYVRELEPNDTQLNYSTICDPDHSRYIFSCNQTRTASLDGSKGSRQFEINTDQALAFNPKFKHGKDYIFFSTSNGRQDSLVTTSTKCTMVFRIHFCSDNETCPPSFCSTYGREEVCKMKSSSERSSTPKDVHITDNTTSSLTVAWKAPALNPDTNITYYTICYRTNSSQNCSTKLVEAGIRSAILDNLNSSTVYKIRVRAHMCKGPGNYSEEITQKTKTEVPEYVATTQVPEPAGTSEAPIDTIVSEPRSVRVSNISSSSMKISWQTPAIVNADIIFYKICCLKTDEQQNCSTPLLIEPDKRSAVLALLRPSTSYGIRIMANTAKGAGKYSKEIRRNTTNDSQPVMSRQTGCSKSDIDGVSLVVGLVVGFVAALTIAAIAAIVWLTTLKRRKSAMMNKEPVLQATNPAYRHSVATMDAINKNVNGKASSNDYTLELSAMTDNVD